ncbi:flagellar hook-length control protein FliK [Superficieibacter sp.]|uniref:flagellar hook-length control protein FliK n=1 Tax=Superficieibacter sp. TaxID=2303322 RepID=UPI0028AF96CB|nr:flagellar hook-length control protein FliK [Superficieibacter sp.]
MKSISLAAGGVAPALTDSPVQGQTVPGAESASADPFTLPQMALASLTERVHAAKNTAAKTPENTDQSAQLQMLLALFLTPPTQAIAEQEMNLASPHVAGQLIQTLAQAQNKSGISAARDNGTFAVGAHEAQPQSSAADTMVLSPKLQAAMASLMQSRSPANPTPTQQAQLVQVAAQNLQAIAPRPENSRPGEQRDTRITARIAASDKPGSEKFSPSSLLTNASWVQQGMKSEHNVALPEPVLTVNTQSEDWGEQLTSLLKDRIQFQMGQQQQTTTIRLDPPALGKLEISIQIDAGKLAVHIGASQADVCRSLQQLSDNLRQQLTEQNFVQVQVQVSPDGQSQQQDRRQGSGRQPQIISAIEPENEDNHFKQNDSVLIKV